MVTVWFDGIDEMNTIATELHSKQRRIGAQGSAVVRASAFKVQAVGMLFCPVDTGLLRSTISPDFFGDGRMGAMEAVIGPTAHYGGYVEWGTRNMAPHAYMGPALDRVGPEFVAATAAISDPFDGGMRGARGGGRVG